MMSNTRCNGRGCSHGHASSGSRLARHRAGWVEGFLRPPALPLAWGGGAGVQIRPRRPARHGVARCQPVHPCLSATRHGSGSGRTIRQPRMSFDRASMSPAIAGAHGFRVNNAGHLEIGGVDALALARDFGTPLHVLDEERLRANCREYRDTLAEAYGPNARAIFASKACCTIATCQIAHQEGLGVDVASGGELHTGLRAGVPARDLYFHGNNKTLDEVEYGLRTGVGRCVVDNEHEFDLLETVTARLDTTADILLRLTPGIEPHTHQAIRTGGVDSKFGFGMLDGAAYRAVVRASRMPRVRLRGLHAHIGSQVCDLEPFRMSAAALVDFAARIRDELDVTVEELNLGGGLGIRYVPADEPPRIADFVRALAADAATDTVAVAGRCCESGDVLIWEARLPPVRSGDLLAVFGTGAYTYSMASNYNRFPRPAVVLAGHGRGRCVVERETYDDLLRKDVSL